MNKKIFIILLFVLALGITLGAVYYLNISSMNQKPVNNVSERKDDTSNQPQMDSALLDSSGNIVIDENTPKDYKNPELMNLEKEINNLDLSNEGDIE